MKNIIYQLFVYFNLFSLFLILVVFLFLFFKKTKKNLFNFLKKFGYQMIFLISFLSLIGSLSFSEILKWPPCKLCWYQRIFMYPQVFISLISLKIKDKNGYYYHFWLSLFGFLIALFHYLIQKGLIKEINCDLVSFGNTCFLKINFSFGFISIPFMALTAFFMIIVISLSALSKQNN
ncbi:MAG: disulfide bond formation protein B, partial [Patescibacteria group bacterium]|nr:disulfide bond formation protein B [Patescibacteria group bacterium]